jgi:hypothetical protein
MRQKTFLTTRGIVFVGFFVSPAVMAIDSVPPSKTLACSMIARRPTRKRSRDEDRRESADATNKWCSRQMPVASTDILMVNIAATIYRNAQDYEDYYSKNLKQAQPILELRNCQRDN